ncbi:MAG: 3-dehydroquinate synthase [Oceanicoccus sp.]
MTTVNELIANLDGTPYPIYIGKGVLGNIADYLQGATENPKILILFDTFFENTVAADIRLILEARGYDVFLHAMPAGKGNKNINEALKIFAVLEENNFARDSTLIAVGGGVIGDMSGFIASTWLRGMNLVHVPTTLLAMVDSSVGGKTAINFRQTINGIGSYYHPVFNLIDLDLVDTLSARDYHSGLAEVIKCAVINDQDFYLYLDKEREAILARSHKHVTGFIQRTIEIKINHVQGDVKEGGKRLLLNYGHTLGHAIEISTEKDNQEQLRHGEGVSIGIMAVAYIATRHLGVPQEVYDSLKQIFTSYNLPTSISSSELGFERYKLLESCKINVHKDKKRLGNKLRLILADRIGNARVYNDVSTELVEQAFDHVIRD